MIAVGRTDKGHLASDDGDRVSRQVARPGYHPSS
jgi:hypothetical protein